MKPLWHTTKPHDASSRKTSCRITRKLFQTSKHQEKIITFLRKNDYFLRRNTNLEISSFKAIYFSDCVFNLTMPK